MSRNQTASQDQPNNSVPMQRMLATLAACAAGVLATTAAEGFESREHREMSDLAVSVVLEMTKDSQRVRIPQKSIEALEKYRPHYGRITECVDYFMIPEKMLAFGWKNSSTISKTALDPNSIPSIEYPVWEGLLKQCVPQSMATIQATHHNHAHFQQDLLMALRVWHMNAIATAQTESNVYGGLFINSISDHYLHDFFAPGHLVTSRDRLTDLPSTATHDLANQMGALFRPSLSKENTPGALRALEFLCQADPGSFTSDNPQCAPSQEIEALLNVQGRSINIRIDDLKADAIALKNGRPILLRGDDQLKEDSQARQRTLMLVVQVASILDVLEGTNSLRKFHFSFSMDEGLPTAHTNFGSYDFKHTNKSIPATLDDSKYTALLKREEADQSAKYFPIRFTPCSFGGCKDQFYEPRTRSPIFSLSLQRESHVNRSAHQRSMVSIEGSTVGLVWDASKFSGEWLDGVEIVPSFGYTHYHENGFRGNGPLLRLSASVPETEFSLGAYARWLTYPSSGGNVRKASFGLRADTGFSGYFTFFISGGTDHAVNSTGSLSKGLILGAGIRVGAPWTRMNTNR